MKKTGGAKRKGKSLCRPARAPTPASFTALESGCMWLYCVCLFVFVGRVVLNVGIQLSWRPTVFVRYLVGEADGDELADGLGLRRAQVLVVGQGLAPVPCGIVW